MTRSHVHSTEINEINSALQMTTWRASCAFSSNLKSCFCFSAIVKVDPCEGLPSFFLLATCRHHIDSKISMMLNQTRRIDDVAMLFGLSIG